jgi:hypothetical protein
VPHSDDLGQIVLQLGPADQLASGWAGAARRATPLASAARATAEATALTTSRLNTLGMMYSA